MRARIASISLAVALVSTTALAQSSPAATTPTQLPRTAVPSHYSINLAPDADNLRFSAESASGARLME